MRAASSCALRSTSLPFAAALALTLASEPARAQSAASTTATTSDQSAAAVAETVPKEDRTGGAYTTPTLLFIPAGAVPAWNVRAVVSTDLQSRADVDATIRPGIGAELGLPAGITIGAGTNWVGGDKDPDTGKTDFSLGISPYAQARLHLVGDADGRGLQLGTSATYKFVGFAGDPGEIELALSAQYRQAYYEVGLQGAIGQDFGDSNNHDGEVHAYALVRPVPQLGVGAAGQLRVAIAPKAGDPNGPTSTYDVLGGALGSLTLDRYQLGVLAGASTLGLAQGQVAALGQIFGTARF